MFVRPWHEQFFCKQGPFSAHLERRHQPLGYPCPQACCVFLGQRSPLATSIWPIPASCLCHSSVPWTRSTSPCMDKQEIICSRVNTSSCNWSFCPILEFLFTKTSEHSTRKISNNSKVASRCFRVPDISHLPEKSYYCFYLPSTSFCSCVPFIDLIFLKNCFCFETIHALLAAWGTACLGTLWALQGWIVPVKGEGSLGLPDM